MSLFIFFLYFLFLFYRLPFIESLFKLRCYFISIFIVCHSINLDSWDVAIIWNFYSHRYFISKFIMCLSINPNSWNAAIIWNSYSHQPPHLLTSHFFFSINFQLFSLYKLIGMAFNVIVFWVFFCSFGHGSSLSTKAQSNECKRQIITLKLANETKADDRWTLVA